MELRIGQRVRLNDDGIRWVRNHYGRRKSRGDHTNWEDRTGVVVGFKALCGTVKVRWNGRTSLDFSPSRFLVALSTDPVDL